MKPLYDARVGHVLATPGATVVATCHRCGAGLVRPYECPRRPLAGGSRGQPGAAPQVFRVWSPRRKPACRVACRGCLLSCGCCCSAAVAVGFAVARVVSLRRSVGVPSQFPEGVGVFESDFKKRLKPCWLLFRQSGLALCGSGHQWCRCRSCDGSADMQSPHRLAWFRTSSWNASGRDRCPQAEWRSNSRSIQAARTAGIAAVRPRAPTLPSN